MEVISRKACCIAFIVLLLLRIEVLLVAFLQYGYSGTILDNWHRIYVATGKPSNVFKTIPQSISAQDEQKIEKELERRLTEASDEKVSFFLQRYTILAAFTV